MTSVSGLKKKEGKKSSEGVFSSLISPRPFSSYCQTLKSVLLTFSLHTFHFLWVISWYIFWQPNQNEKFLFPVPFALLMGINPFQWRGCHFSGCFWVSDILHLISFWSDRIIKAKKSQGNSNLHLLFVNCLWSYFFNAAWVYWNHGLG